MFNTYDTVARDTPASRATSALVGMAGAGDAGSLGAGNAGGVGGVGAGGAGGAGGAAGGFDDCDCDIAVASLQTHKCGRMRLGRIEPAARRQRSGALGRRLRGPGRGRRRDHGGGEERWFRRAGVKGGGGFPPVQCPSGAGRPVKGAPPSSSRRFAMAYGHPWQAVPPRKDRDCREAPEEREEGRDTLGAQPYLPAPAPRHRSLHGSGEGGVCGPPVRPSAPDRYTVPVRWAAAGRGRCRAPQTATRPR
ncbi:hypothetical protein GCM10010286_02680 [Streptomyces toxytricini]|nr:hypothetical protein GCM10010286_02680 [Streptomyces toxytricini]